MPIEEGVDVREDGPDTSGSRFLNAAMSSSSPESTVHKLLR